MSVCRCSRCVVTLGSHLVTALSRRSLLMRADPETFSLQRELRGAVCRILSGQQVVGWIAFGK